MERHIPNIDPAITVVAHGTVDSIGRRQAYSINRLGDEVREPQPDGSVITRRPVGTTMLIVFGTGPGTINDEALLSIIEDRLADRAASEFGTRRIDGALSHVRKALAAVQQDATKPMRRRSTTAPGVIVVANDPGGAEPPPVPADERLDEHG